MDPKLSKSLGDDAVWVDEYTSEAGDISSFGALSSAPRTSRGFTSEIWRSIGRTPKGVCNFGATVERGGPNSLMARSRSIKNDGISIRSGKSPRSPDPGLWMPGWVRIQSSRNIEEKV